MLIWSTFGRIITYLRKKVCSKECSFLGGKIITFTYLKVYTSTLDLSKRKFCLLKRASLE